MIHRKTTKTLADAYHAVYSGRYEPRGRAYVGGSPERFRIDIDGLHDFLYELEYPTWFLFLVKKIDAYRRRALIDFVVGIHTGVSLFEITKEWTWQQREKEGQELLRRLSQDVLLQSELEFLLKRVSLFEKGEINDQTKTATLHPRAEGGHPPAPPPGGRGHFRSL